jgi:tetratricopeptide (TPR) repeat protein
VALALAVPVGLWGARELAARQAARAAGRALDEGRLEEATDALDRWEARQPQSAELHYLRARLAWARRDPPAVQRELSRARALGFPAPAMAGLRGLVLAGTNQATEAEPLLQQALDQGGRVDPEVAAALVRIYLGAYRLARAAEVLERWRGDWPDAARPYFLQTEIDARNHASDDEILAHYRAALDRDPNLGEARLRLANFLQRIHLNAEAAAEYETYQHHKPDDPLGHLGAGQNSLELGDLPAAVRHLDRALELSPGDPVVLAARAAAATRQGQIDAARDFLDRAMKADPFDYEIRYQRMLLLLRQGHKREADEERLVVERIRKEQGEFTELRHRLERSPLDQQLRSQAAIWLMSHGHEEEAVDWARLVLQANPADPAMNRLLADYYRKAGNTGLANFHEAHAAPSGGKAAGP